MSTSANKALVRRWVNEVLNPGDWTDRSPAYQLLAHDFVAHLAGPPDVTGAEAWIYLWSIYFGAFPDFHLEVEDLFAEGGKVALRYRWSGTHKGALMGIPATGKQVMASGIVICRIAMGKIAELWDHVDTLGILRQIGVVPAMV